MFSGFNRISYFRNMANTNLDKAALEYANELYGTNWMSFETTQDSGFKAISNFKAGANWQAQQPVTEEQFKRYVIRELDSCGYFMADLDADLIQKINPDWKPYSSKSFGEMLLDFACQYNMEHGGKNYEYKLVEE